jgi:hypothetical protein
MGLSPERNTGSPKTHVGKGGQTYQTVEKWRERSPGKNSAFISVMRNPIKLLVGITYRAVEESCWVRLKRPFFPTYL